MIKLSRFFTIGLLMLLAFTAIAQEDKDLPNRPSPPQLVNDLGNVLSGDEESSLENKLEAYDDSTSTQIAVITVPTVEPYDIAEYAFAIGRKWGVGQKDLNNGIVLLVAVNDHKMWIATGYGTESYITDARASDIYRNILAPAFRQNNYYDGIDSATTQMIGYLSGAFDDSGDTYGTPQNSPNLLGIILVIFIIIVIIRAIRRGGGGGTTFSGRGPTYWGGGGFGGFGGGGFGGFGGGSFGGGGAGGSW